MSFNFLRVAWFTVLILLLASTHEIAGQDNKGPAAETAPSSAELALRSGPMVGYGELTEVALWVQTTRPAQVQFRHWPQGQPGKAQLTPALATTAEGDHIAHFVLSRLPSGTRFEYELYLDGRLVPRPYRLAFQTQPQWQWRTDPPNFTVAFGSCAFINEPEFDRPGTPYGGEYHIFQTIAALQPDVMLWLGDNIYYREPDFFSVAHMRHRNAHGRALPELQALLGSTHHYAIWDDHDYGPNNSDWTYRMKQEALAIFKTYWANPTYGLEDTPGVFFSFTWGDVDFFMLDDRYHRSPSRAPVGPDKVMFGARQMRWLKDALVFSRAPFKIIVNGNQMLMDKVADEGFGLYPQEQAEMVQWLKEAKIYGVLFLSGDVHHTELLRRPEPDFYPLYDYTNSPFTSGTHSADRIAAHPWRVPGTLVAAKRNFGMLRFSGPRQERVLTMACHDNAGQLLWQHQIKAAELQVK